MYNAHPILRMFIFFTNLDILYRYRARYLPENIPVYTAQSHFLPILDIFCIDNARVIYRKIRYLLVTLLHTTVTSILKSTHYTPPLVCHDVYRHRTHFNIAYFLIYILFG
jgi:hypothetical protein